MAGFCLMPCGATDITLLPDTTVMKNATATKSIELKTGKLTHQDLGQLQMYVNYYDRVEKTSEENPTIGILLCTDKNDTAVRMALPEDNKTILASEKKV